MSFASYFRYPISLAALFLLLSHSLIAANYPAPKEGDYVVHNFHFSDGESIPELRLHYATLGTAARDANGAITNAVLLLESTSSSWKQFTSPQFGDVLFGPGQLLDASTHFIIMSDAIGNGGSAKPSDGLKGHFPHYDSYDRIVAQHQLLTEALGVKHVSLVLGTSGGCMEAWVWGETYPDFMDALMPIACLPVEIGGRNRVVRKLIIDSIRSDPGFNNGEYVQEPLQGLGRAYSYLMIATGSAEQWQKHYPTREQADQFADDFIKERLTSMDANDLLYSLEASRTYDPSPNLGKIKAFVMHVNTADDFMDPPELGIAEREIKLVPHGKFVLIPISEETRGHLTHTMAAVWKGYLKELMEMSSKSNAANLSR
jgi:homoserine O-acetyltransferase/O-succinyltransferase